MGTPVVFVHGLWLHATSWDPWVELFADAGYAPIAPGWPGDLATVEQTRAHPDALADRGIDEVVSHYAALIADLPSAPIVIGHSVGGTMAQKLLGQGLAAAVVAIDAAPIKGVLPLPLSTVKATLPVFRNPANRHRAVSLTAEQFRFAFGNAVSEAESQELFDRWTIPGPGRPLFEVASANFSAGSPAKVDTANARRGPLLLMAGGRDHTVPETITRATLKQYRSSDAVTDVVHFPDRGHSLTIDSGWHEVAGYALMWLDKYSL